MTGPVLAPRVAGATLGPDEAQRAFRAVLDALARPGRAYRLPERPLRTVPAALLPLLALADLDTPACVLGDDPDGGWQQVLATVTSAPGAALPEARLVAALRPLSGDELLALRRGSAAAPEDGALLSVAVSDVDSGGSWWRLSGPGVAGRAAITPVGLDGQLAAARAQAVAGFPAGIDLLLVGPDGRVLGIPRTTAITVTTEEAS